MQEAVEWIGHRVLRYMFADHTIQFPRSMLSLIRLQATHLVSEQLRRVFSETANDAAETRKIPRQLSSWPALFMKAGTVSNSPACILLKMEIRNH